MRKRDAVWRGVHLKRAVRANFGPYQVVKGLRPSLTSDRLDQIDKRLSVGGRVDKLLARSAFWLGRGQDIDKLFNLAIVWKSELR